MFIELTRKSGTRLALGTAQIIYVQDNGDEGTTVYVRGEMIAVRESYPVVMTRLARVLP